MAAPSRRYALVMNGSAGSVAGADPEERLKTLAAELQKATGHPPVEATTAKGKDLAQAVEHAAAGAADVVVIAGGDGTVSYAAPILRKHGKILAIVPLGTYNLLARDLEIPLETEDAIATLASGVVREIDVATVNGHMFLCQSGFGLFSGVAYARQKFRKKSMLGKWAQSAMAFADAAWRLRRVGITVRADGVKHRFRTLAMLVAINTYHRNPGKMLQRDRLDGGKFALYSVRYRTVAGLILFAVKLVLGRWHKDERLDILASRHLVVTSRRRRNRTLRRRLAITADGELLFMNTPITYEILPRALKILAPAPPPSEPGHAPDRASL